MPKKLIVLLSVLWAVLLSLICASFVKNVPKDMGVVQYFKGEVVLALGCFGRAGGSPIRIDSEGRYYVLDVYGRRDYWSPSVNCPPFEKK